MEVGILIPLIFIIAMLLVVVAGLSLKNTKKTKTRLTNTYVPPQQEPKTAAGKFCTNCGAKLDASCVFCTNCGAKQ